MLYVSRSFSINTDHLMFFSNKIIAFMYICIFIISKKNKYETKYCFQGEIKSLRNTQNVGFLCYVYQNKHLLKVSKTKERDNEYVIL